MKAIGKNINGEEIEFELNSFKLNSFGKIFSYLINNEKLLNELSCYNHKLTEINIPDNVEVCSCSMNYLSELKLNNNLVYLSCKNNQITKLELPDTLKFIDCVNNPIKEITLPLNLYKAFLPLNCIVTNINDFKNKKNIHIKFE